MHDLRQITLTLSGRPGHHHVRNFNISRAFKDASNTIQNFMFMETTVFNIAGGGGGVRPTPPWYKVWFT